MAGAVGGSVDALGGGDDATVVGERVAVLGVVGHEALTVGAHVAEGVVDVGELVGAARVDEVADVVVALLHPPLGEIGDAELVVPGPLGRGARAVRAVDGAVDQVGVAALVDAVEPEGVAPPGGDDGAPARRSDGVALLGGALDGGVPQFVHPAALGQFEFEGPVGEVRAGGVVDGDLSAVAGVPAGGLDVGHGDVAGVRRLGRDGRGGQGERCRQHCRGGYREGLTESSCSHVGGLLEGAESGAGPGAGPADVGG